MHMPRPLGSYEQVAEALEELPRLIRWARRHHRLLLSDVALACGMGSPTLLAIEQRTTPPTTEQAACLLRWLHTLPERYDP